MTRSFYSADEFEWTQILSGQFTNIQEELLGLSADTRAYERLTESIRQGDSPGYWDSSTFMMFTVQNIALMEIAPVTADAILKVPNIVTAHMLDLGPNTHLLPHHGLTPETLRFHLGIDVPEADKCSIRVGNETGSWKNGEWLIFDDFLEHEVWNHGSKTRKVLLIDIVRPGINRPAKEVAHRFFKNAPGSKFDKSMSNVGSREQWLEWVNYDAINAQL